MPLHRKYPRQLPVLLTEEQYQWLVTQGEEKSISAAEVIRQAVDAARKRTTR